MRDFLLFLCGVAGGVLGGLGLGGGTLMIPLLTVGMGVSAALAAEVNLIAFIPASVVAIIVHAKHKLIDGKIALFLSFFSLAGALLAAVTIGQVSAVYLRVGFGVFLIVIGVLSAILDLIDLRQKKKAK